VVWRRGASGSVEILLVHRPKYDDWSFAKGKCDGHEVDDTCALREVEEETGLHCRLGVELPSTEYIDPKGRPKKVRYWAMTVESGRFSPNHEIDAVQWAAVEEANERLSYERDRPVLEALATHVAQAPDSGDRHEP
jgi:8-oxo-dGTP diphosphatase